jgi:hypothetical protein
MQENHKEYNGTAVYSRYASSIACLSRIFHFRDFCGSSLRLNCQSCSIIFSVFFSKNNCLSYYVRHKTLLSPSNVFEHLPRRCNYSATDKVSGLQRAMKHRSLSCFRSLNFLFSMAHFKTSIDRRSPALSGYRGGGRGHYL